MPRPPRVFLEGGIYHVYCRATRREPVFEDDTNAAKLVHILRSVKKRDRFTVFAWCIMPNHYHVAIRTGEVPLWRSMRLIQGRFSQWYNRVNGLIGPVWQGRYKAKLIADEAYLNQVVAYVHLNPVRARLAATAGDFQWSGHNEILDRPRSALVDVDDALMLFGEGRRRATRSYKDILRSAATGNWIDAPPERLPWWDWRTDDTPLQPQEGRPFVDVLGRSSAGERPDLDAAEYLESAADALGIDTEALASLNRHRTLVSLRDLVVTVGAERYGIQVRDLAQVLQRRPDQVSRMIGRAGRRRVSDAGFSERIEWLDRQIMENPAELENVNNVGPGT